MQTIEQQIIGFKGIVLKEKVNTWNMDEFVSS